MRPTRRGIVILSAGLAIAILPTLGVHAAWPLTPIFWGVAALVYGLDASRLPGRDGIDCTVELPEALYVGEKHVLPVELRLRTPRPILSEVVVDASDEIEPPAQAGGEVAGGSGAFRLELLARRRGTARLEAAWIRCFSPAGLWSRVVTRRLDLPIPVLPNLRLVRSVALRFFADRNFRTGLKIERYRGDGTEFDSLKDHLVGDDHRAIDWKSSARHRKLLGRQFRAERNHQIILAVDTGHLMSEHLGDIAKLDHALNSALVLAYVCLRSGDRVGFFSFDGKVGPGIDPVSGVSGMRPLIQVTSQIAYAAEETNFTLGLTALAQRLSRRSLIVLLTDFVDTVTAELMIENVRRLGGRHLVLFVSIRDPLLADLERRRIASVEDLHRAVVSRDLLQEREIVHRRLRRAGVHPLDAEPHQIGPELINHYLDIKRRELV